MNKILSQLNSFTVLTVVVAYCIGVGIIITLFTHGNGAILWTGLFSLVVFVLWYGTLDRKLRKFLLNSRSTIAPLLDQKRSRNIGIFEQMDELEKSLIDLGNRMNYMIDQMADKVLIDQEVQSAELFQSLFFPKERFESKTFVLDGRYLPANQCSGDWWQYFRSGDELLVLIGDVTGHGVSAALVTAAVQAAYSVVISQIRANPEKTASLPSLNNIFSYLNEAVLAVGGTEASMTLFGSVINLKTGSLVTLNASHRPAYVFRNGPLPETEGVPVYHLNKTLLGGQTAPLGEDWDIGVDAHTFQLCPGDFVLWYTDGFLECSNAKGETISKREILGTLQNQMAGKAGNPSLLGDLALQELYNFIGGRMTDRKDDVIVVFGAVPDTAVFTV